ncbi:MAG: hypothetical protein WCD37_05995 [Chloroflexia bacterium]
MTLLKMHPYHLSDDKAKQAVDETLREAGYTEPADGWHKSSVTINGKAIPALELLREMRLTGVIKDVQQRLDQADPVFGGIISLATTAAGLHLHLTHRDYDIDVQGPGLIMPIEGLISADILYFRRCVCKHSSEPDFELTSRYFRTYIFSCVAMIEHFMYRYLWVLASSTLTKSAAEEILSERGERFEVRIDKWLQLVTGYGLSHISRRVEWAHFKKLRELRNDLIHGAEPYFAFSITDMADYLNYVQRGIGGLMRLVRELQGHRSLMFIESLRTAPPAKYVNQ